MVHNVHLTQLSEELLGTHEGLELNEALRGIDTSTSDVGALLSEGNPRPNHSLPERISKGRIGTYIPICVHACSDRTCTNEASPSFETTCPELGGSHPGCSYFVKGEN